MVNSDDERRRRTVCKTNSGVWKIIIFFRFLFYILKVDFCYFESYRITEDFFFSKKPVQVEGNCFKNLVENIETDKENFKRILGEKKISFFKSCGQLVQKCFIL